MGVQEIEANAAKCPCNKLQKYKDFQQLIELKSNNVIVYCHKSKDIAKEVGNSTSGDVYILHNAKNNNILAADILSQLDINKVTCSRCRQIYEHARKLFNKTHGTYKKDVIGICDHCRLNAIPQKPCNICDKIIKKFLKASKAQKGDHKEDIKTWLAKIGELINKTQQNVRLIKKVRRPRSQIDFKDLLYQGLSKSVRDFKTEPMFQSKITLSDTDITVKRKYSRKEIPELQISSDVEESLEPDYTLRKLSSSGSIIRNVGKYTQDSDYSEHFKTVSRRVKQKVSSEHEIFNDKAEKDSTKLLHVENKPPKMEKVNQISKMEKLGEIKLLEEGKRKLETSPKHRLEMKKVKKITKASKVKSVIDQNDISTATKIRNKHVTSTESDEMPREKRQILSEVDEPPGKQQHISTASAKMLLIKKHKLSKNLNFVEKGNKEKTTGAQDFFKDKPAQAIPKVGRFKQADDLVAKKQKSNKNMAKIMNMEDGSKGNETLYKGDNVDILKNLKQLKSRKSETAHLKNLNKSVTIDAKSKAKTKTKDLAENNLKPVPQLKLHSPKDKDKRQTGEVETKEDIRKDVHGKEKQNVTDLKEFKKLRDELAKNKEKDLKNQKQAEIELQKVKDAAHKKVNETTQGNVKSELERLNVKQKTYVESKDNGKIQSNEAANKNLAEVTKLIKSKEKHDHSNLRAFRKLQEDHVKNKEKELKQQKAAEIELQKVKQIAYKKEKEALTEEVQARNGQKAFSPKAHLHRASSDCIICNDTDWQIAAVNYTNALQSEPRVIIIGEQVTKFKQILSAPQAEEDTIKPMLFHSQYLDKLTLSKPQTVDVIKKESKDKANINTAIIKAAAIDKVDPESNKGIIRYALSDRTFIDKGWTMLPTEKVVRKMNVYRMRPAHPEFDWFEHNKNKRLMLYDTGEKLADFDDKGRGRWYYRNGRIALDYYDAEENAQQRFVVYSSGEPDKRGRSHPITILATFDYLGNGIVFDHGGKIRLKYNQTEGVVLDRSIGPVSNWKWHTLNDPPVLQQVMIDTQLAHKDPTILKMCGPHDKKPRPDNEDMLAIEFDNFIKEKSKKLSQKFKPFQIKMKALKINEHFSLRVLDQATVYLIFRDGSTNLKLNIGMILDHQEIVDTDTAEVGEVSNSLERFPARTDSLAGLQRSVAYAQRYERTRTERERRLRPPEPCASADMLIATASRPLQPPLRTVPTISTCSSGCLKKYTKTTNNLYYNPRLC